MKRTLKDLFELYRPKVEAEVKFVDKHVVIKHKDANGNGDDVFKATNIKKSERKKERHGYEPGEDELVYEDTAPIDEAVQVVKKTFPWGKMVTVHDGAHQSFPLHPEHQQKIAGLSAGDKTSFKDETGATVHAERTGSLVHLKKADTNRTAAVAFSHFKEDLDEAKVAVTKGNLENNLIGADSVKKHGDGTHSIARGFFYRSGSTSEGHADRISKGLDKIGLKHKVIDHGTQDYRPFKGGASVWTQNHHWVKVRIEPGQKINEETLSDELTEVSKATTDSYLNKTAPDSGAMDNLPTDKWRKRVIMRGTAHDKLSGNTRRVKVPATEEIINRAIEKFVPEMADWTPMTPKEKLLATIEWLPEGQIFTMLSLFDTLTENNQRTMIDTCKTREGVSELLNFAIENRGK